MNADPPGTTPYGTPVQKIPLGTTSLSQEFFHEFLNEMRHKYTLDRYVSMISTLKLNREGIELKTKRFFSYNLISNNCNHFTDDASQFLTGNPIPSRMLFSMFS